MKKRDVLTILGIDTSCDDTCISFINVKCNFEVLSNIVSSQVRIHRKYGGVYPFLAKRAHQKNLPIVFKKALLKSGMENYRSQIVGDKSGKLGINLIAVTVGPGLEPCLWMGINFAKKLAKKLKLKIVPVNHIEAHIMANFIRENFQFSTSGFQKFLPAICLIVSGGHTQLILMKEIGKYKILGETRDDAAGECFDKTARILGLGYPGGPAIEAEAEKYQMSDVKYQIKLPRPMIYQKNYDFSFSGLKTAVLYDFKNRPLKIKKSKIYIREMAKEIQQAIIDVLIYKTLKAARNYKVRSIILGGGVTANKELRKQFKLKIENCKLKINFLVPQEKLCTDNAVMVAVAGYFGFKRAKTKDPEKIEANANLRL